MCVVWGELEIQIADRFSDFFPIFQASTKANQEFYHIDHPDIVYRVKFFNSESKSGSLSEFGGISVQFTVNKRESGPRHVNQHCAFLRQGYSLYPRPLSYSMELLFDDWANENDHTLVCLSRPQCIVLNRLSDVLCHTFISVRVHCDSADLCVNFGIGTLTSKFNFTTSMFNKLQKLCSLQSNQNRN